MRNAQFDLGQPLGLYVMQRFNSEKKIKTIPGWGGIYGAVIWRFKV
jgi:hypothetical protein